jgi:hypothetical protein
MLFTFFKFTFNVARKTLYPNITKHLQIFTVRLAILTYKSRVQ